METNNAADTLSNFLARNGMIKRPTVVAAVAPAPVAVATPSVGPVVKTAGKHGNIKYKLVTPYGTFRRDTIREYNFCVVQIAIIPAYPCYGVRWTGSLESALKMRSAQPTLFVIYDMAGNVVG